jgi:hypothetical protein
MLRLLLFRGGGPPLPVPAPGVVRRHRNGHVNGATPRTLSVVVDHIADIARLHSV